MSVVALAEGAELGGAERGKDSEQRARIALVAGDLSLSLVQGGITEEPHRIFGLLWGAVREHCATRVVAASVPGLVSQEARILKVVGVGPGGEEILRLTRRRERGADPGLTIRRTDHGLGVSYVTAINLATGDTRLGVDVRGCNSAVMNRPLEDGPAGAIHDGAELLADMVGHVRGLCLGHDPAKDADARRLAEGMPPIIHAAVPRAGVLPLSEIGAPTSTQL